MDVLGISILSGAHNTLVPKIMDGLEEYGARDDTMVLVGGIIPDDDTEFLREEGVAEIFGPGASMDEMVDYIRANAPERR